MIRPFSSSSSTEDTEVHEGIESELDEDDPELIRVRVRIGIGSLTGGVKAVAVLRERVEGGNNLKARTIYTRQLPGSGDTTERKCGMGGHMAS